MFYIAYKNFDFEGKHIPRFFKKFVTALNGFFLFDFKFPSFDSSSVSHSRTTWLRDSSRIGTASRNLTTEFRRLADKSIAKKIKSPSRNGTCKIARLPDERSYIVVRRAASISRRNCSVLFSSGPLTFRKNGKQLPRSDMRPVRLAFSGGRDGGNKEGVSLTRQSARFNDRDETRRSLNRASQFARFFPATSTTTWQSD